MKDPLLLKPMTREERDDIDAIKSHPLEVEELLILLLTGESLSSPFFVFRYYLFKNFSH